MSCSNLDYVPKLEINNILAESFKDQNLSQAARKVGIQKIRYTIG